MSFSPIVCNGTPKSGTHALLQAVEALGFQKRAFVKAIGKDVCYSRPISYGDESIFLSQDAKRHFDDYLKNAHTYRGKADVRAFLMPPQPIPTSVHAHVAWRRRDLLEGMRVVTVIRGPRNNFLSWIRWFGPSAAANFFPVYASFVSWRKEALFVYEDLWTVPSIRALADTLGVTVSAVEAERVIGSAKGRSLTWTNQPSNHTAVWNSSLDALWKAKGGDRLDALYQAVRESNGMRDQDEISSIAKLA